MSRKKQRSAPTPWATRNSGHPVELDIVSVNGRIVARGVYHEEAELICETMNKADETIKLVLGLYTECTGNFEVLASVGEEQPAVVLRAEKFLKLEGVL